ncbi:MAG: hypothetical protein FD169_738 [Bacillota bacterium]|nr:MAG: hypothetical protein FD169_738 [Bacillota bacterium]
MRIQGRYLIVVCMLATLIVAASAWFNVISQTSRLFSNLVTATAYLWGLAGGFYLYYGIGYLTDRVGRFLITYMLILMVYWQLVPDMIWSYGGPVSDRIGAWGIGLIASAQSLVLSLVAFYLIQGARRIVRSKRLLH